MSAESIINHFQNLSPINEEDKVDLHKAMQEESFEKNDIIQRPGSRCKTLYFVSTGIARIFYLKDGNDVTEHFAFNGNIIIRAESLFTEQITQKGIQALTHIEMVRIDANDLFQLCLMHPNIERLFHQIIIKEYLNATKRIESLQLLSAHERYNELLIETNLVKHIPLKYIASYLGITQVSLSRIRANA
jgi:CRP-like cAMP-binding protein